MIKLINLDSFCEKLEPVTTTDIFVGKSQQFHSEGLFSEDIFGYIETPERAKTFSYINLNCKIIHPVLMATIRRINRKILDSSTGFGKYTIEKGVLTEIPDGVSVKSTSTIIDGYSSLVKHYDEIKHSSNESIDRQNLIDMINYYHKNNLLFIDKCVIIPAAYRDIQFNDDGDINSPPINEYYMKILRVSNQISSMTSGPVFDSLSYKMYTCVLELYTYLQERLSKKEGLIRSAILSKTVDFSGRAVIVGSGADIRPNQVGIPFRIAVKLYEPFIIHYLLKQYQDQQKLEKALNDYNGEKLSPLSLRRLFLAINKNDLLSDELNDIMKQVLTYILKDKAIILKRDPVLHPESSRGFYPVLVDGNAIKLHPVVCDAYNADFDGDSCLSKVELLISNNKKVIANMEDLENLEI